MTHWKELEKILPFYFTKYQKIIRKDVSSFPGISKNCQNHGLFEGALMGRPKYPIWLFWSRMSRTTSKICNTPKCVYVLSTIAIFEAELPRKIDFFTLPSTHNICYFKILCVKRPQLSNNTKFGFCVQVVKNDKFIFLMN